MKRISLKLFTIEEVANFVNTVYFDICEVDNSSIFLFTKV